MSSQSQSRTPSVFSQSSRSRSGTSASSALSKSSKALALTSKAGSSKVTEGHFTPRMRRLAIASKTHVRTSIVYHPNGPFNLANTHLGKIDFLWRTIKETAQNSKDTTIKEALKRASKDEKIKKSLVTFVSHFFLI